MSYDRHSKRTSAAVHVVAWRHTRRAHACTSSVVNYGAREGTCERKISNSFPRLIRERVSKTWERVNLFFFRTSLRRLVGLRSKLTVMYAKYIHEDD